MALVVAVGTFQLKLDSQFWTNGRCRKFQLFISRLNIIVHLDLKRIKNAIIHQSLTCKHFYSIIQYLFSIHSFSFIYIHYSLTPTLVTAPLWETAKETIVPRQYPPRRDTTQEIQLSSYNHEIHSDKHWNCSTRHRRHYSTGHKESHSKSPIVHPECVPRGSKSRVQHMFGGCIGVSLSKSPIAHLGCLTQGRKSRVQHMFASCITRGHAKQFQCAVPMSARKEKIRVSANQRRMDELDIVWDLASER